MKRSRSLMMVLIVVLCTTLFAGSAFAGTYTVKKGDTLWRIAKDHGTTVSMLQNLNKIKDADYIQIGQVLQLPDKNVTTPPPVPVPVPAQPEPKPEPKPDASAIDLTILGTSDVHGNLWGYTYEDGTETTDNGLARISTYVKEVRETSKNVILLDNGDTYQGNIMTDDIYNKNPDVVHPVSKAMNELGYSAMTLGNHEFNFGLDLIDKIQKELKFPVLGANILGQDGSNFVDPYAILTVNGLKIGVIGVTTPNVPRWDGDKVASLTFLDMAESVQKYAKELKEQEKADLIIVTSHAGLNAEYDEEGGSDAAKKIVELVPDVDVLLVGHMHITVNEQIGDTIVGGPRNLGREVVRFDLKVKKENGSVQVADQSVTIVDMANYEPDPQLRDLIQEEHDATNNFIHGGGGADGEGGSGGVFGQASADFQPVNEITGIPEGKLRDTAVVDLINKVQLQVSGADVSAAALFKDTSDLKKGDINYGNIFDIYKFDNTLYVVKVTGKELKAYMEWSASHYNQWKPGDISISFDPEVPGYLYDMFAGVDYKIDLSKPVGQRIVDVMYKGEPLSDTQELNLAVNNYRYSSGLKAYNLVAGTKHWESPRSIRDYLVEYIKERKVIDPEVDNNWEITGVDLSSPYRDQVIQLVNEGKLEVPYDKSLNINELKEAGVIEAE